MNLALFSAYGLNGQSFCSNEVITFEKVFVDSREGENFNLNTGELTVPISGNYEFSLYASKCDSSTNVYIQKNGNLEFYLHNSDSRYNPISASWQMKLEKEDKISLKVTQGCVRYSYPRLFSGKLLD